MVIPALSQEDDSDDDPEEFWSIDMEAFRVAVTTWKREYDSTPPVGAKPPPPLNPTQRQFAREHLAAQRRLTAGRRRGEDPNRTLEDLQQQGLSLVSLLQGAGGVGKSVLLAAMDRVLTKLGLGAMVVTAWTGVASAPFGTPTLCSLLKIDFCTMAQTKPITEEAMNVWRAKFAEAACDPEDLLVLTIDETSFLVPKVLYHVDVQLRRLRGRPDVPFGGVALILAGDFC